MSKAMILAAGSGKRMKNLGLHTPKALFEIDGTPLIAHHLKRIAAHNIDEVVINLAHLGKQITASIGDGSAYGLKVTYSQEPAGGYETGGGIHHALPLLGDAPFIVINADIWTDFPLSLLPQPLDGLAHLVLVDNPAENPNGDFAIDDQGFAIDATPNNKPFTFSGIGFYHPQLFKDCKPGRFKLPPILEAAMRDKQVTAQHYTGEWYDIGTPERLAQLQQATKDGS